MGHAFDQAINDLVEKGWHTSLDFFPSSLLHELRQTLLTLKEQEEFRHALVGKGKGKTYAPSIRGDLIRWLSDTGDFPSTQQYLNYLNEFRLRLNRELYLGIHEYEAHFAIYPKGTFYKKHLDRHRDNPHRVLTTTLYLNQDYHTQQGGALILEDLKQAKIATLLPEWGRFVCFLSADFPHQVLPTTVERFSLTGWMRER